ncbi:MAG: hypothetical protein IPK82_19525 [Polyangiaceae bacterium]|nr:hypothetical protein [Polyangiaceae bacterium]
MKQSQKEPKSIFTSLKARCLSNLQPLVLGAGLLAGLFVACTDDAIRPTEGGPTFGATIAADNLENPVDAVPSPDASVIYYIAEKDGIPTVFSVDASGGASTSLHSGATFVAPRGVVTSSDGETLYVADPGAKAVFALPVDGSSAPEVVAGTGDIAAAAIDLKEEGGTDRLYIAGKDLSGEAAVMAIDAEGGTLETLSSGMPLMEPDGVAATSDGYVYIADRAAGGGSVPGRVFVWHGGSTVSDMGLKMVPGTPTGIAVNANENVALISTLNAETGASEVILLQNLNNVWIQPIEGSSTSGGVHCSREKNVCAWAGFNRAFRVTVGDVTSSSIGGAGD